MLNRITDGASRNWRGFISKSVPRFFARMRRSIGETRIEQAHRMFSEIAPLWVNVSNLIDRAGRTGDQQELVQASALLLDIADKERSAMELLL